MKALCRALALVMVLALSLSLPAAAAAEPAEAPDRDLTPLPTEWFDDAVFLGDSVLYTLAQYCETNGALGDALFFSERSLHVESAVNDYVQILYKGQFYFPLNLISVLDGGKLFILLGINDIGGTDGVNQTLDMWAELCGKIGETRPDLQLFLLSCFPMWTGTERYSLNNNVIRDYNEGLRAFCEENGFVFVDTADYFRGPDGGIDERYSSDHYVHLSNDAAVIWAEQMKNPANYSIDPRSFDHENDA